MVVVAASARSEPSGEMHQITVPERSTVKPLRAVAFMQSGLARSAGLAPEELSLVAGSHSGTAKHVTQLRRMMQKLRVDVDDLRCQPRGPLGADGAAQIATGQLSISKLTNECSGEHVAAVALSHWLADDDYLNINGPVQEAYRSYISTLDAAYGRRQVTHDACGMPSRLLPLEALAQRWARFTGARAFDEDVAVLLDAVWAEPEMYAGNGRPVTEMMRRSVGNLVGKCGAGGVYVVAEMSSEMAFAAHCLQGEHWPAFLGIGEALSLVGIRSPTDWRLEAPATAEVASVGP